MPKILVTGGAGYIGSILCGRLVEDNMNQVIVYDNFTYGVDQILPLIDKSNFEVVEGDVRSSELGCLISKVDIVIHLAAIVGFPACKRDPWNAVSTNVDGTKNVLQHLTQSQILIYASTGSIYGRGRDFCSEDNQPHPISLYATTKYQAEQMVFEHENTIALRFATVFGVSPRMRMDLLVNDLVFQAVRNRAIVVYEKGARRTFLHCRDAAESYLLAMNRFGDMRGQIYNVGNPNLNLTKNDLVSAIRRFVNFAMVDEDIGEDLDARDYSVNFAKIIGQGYRPKYSLEDGIIELLKLYSIPAFNCHLRNA